MKRAIYVDYENVNISGLKGIEELTHDDVVKIFIGAQTSKLSMVDANRIFNCEASVELITNKYIGKNALDFIIMVHMGHDIALELAKAYYIISKDKGYDPAIHEMRKLSGLTVARREDIVAVLDEKKGFGKTIKNILGIGKVKESPDTTEHTVVGKGKKDSEDITRITRNYVKEEKTKSDKKKGKDIPNASVTPKSDAEQNKNVIQKNNSIQKKTVAKNKTVTQKHKVDHNKNVSQKNNVDHNKTVTQKNNVDHNKTVTQKNNVEHNKAVTQKNNVDHNKTVTQNNDVTQNSVDIGVVQNKAENNKPTSVEKQNTDFDYRNTGHRNNHKNNHHSPADIKAVKINHTEVNDAKVIALKEKPVETDDAKVISIEEKTAGQKTAEQKAEKKPAGSGNRNNKRKRQSKPVKKQVPENSANQTITSSVKESDSKQETVTDKNVVNKPTDEKPVTENSVNKKNTKHNIAKKKPYNKKPETDKPVIINAAPDSASNVKPISEKQEENLSEETERERQRREAFALLAELDEQENQNSQFVYRRKR
ncbi:MAG: PIN domain-containing protein [Lachnospiraceae bacterium]